MKTAYLMQEDTIEYKLMFDDNGIEAFALDCFVENPKWYVPNSCMVLSRNNRVAEIIFSDRVWDRGYAKSALQLEAMGLHGYDPYQIARKTCGLMACDPRHRWIWFEEDYSLQPSFDSVVASCAELWKKVTAHIERYNKLTRGVRSIG